MLVCDEEYELFEIFSQDQIYQKRPKVCTVCGRTVVFCIWKSLPSTASWKYCLDCQDDNLPEWHLDWNNHLTSHGVVLPLSLRNHLSTMSSKNAACKIPYFCLSISIEQRTHNNQNIYKYDEPVQRTTVFNSDFDSTMSPSHKGTQDVSSSLHNDPLESPSNPDDLNNQVLDESMNTVDPCLEITNNTELLITETVV